jgi:phosphatidylserine decarboxylase
MQIARGGWPYIIGAAMVFVLGVWVDHLQMAHAAFALYIAGTILTGFMIYFFRDPERMPPVGITNIVSGADGWVRSVEQIREENYLKTETWRISTFLTPFDVHVNRAPMAGTVRALAYTPGKHILTIQQAASEYNEHSAILIEGNGTRCLVKQIVGPIVRRVVYWLKVDQVLRKGDRIGIMKFGSRLDVYLPLNDVEVMVKKGDRVFAGLTVIARMWENPK